MLVSLIIGVGIEFVTIGLSSLSNGSIMKASLVRISIHYYKISSHHVYNDRRVSY